MPLAVVATVVFTVVQTAVAKKRLPMVVPMVETTDGIEMALGCEEYEGFGCYFLGYEDGMAADPGRYHVSDGQTCFDQTHNIFVGISYGGGEDEGADGKAFFFKLNPDNTMTRLLSAEGSELGLSGYPLSADCH